MPDRAELVDELRRRLAGRLCALAAIKLQLAGRLPRAYRRFLDAERGGGARSLARALRRTWRELCKNCRVRYRQPTVRELSSGAVAEPNVVFVGFHDNPIVSRRENT